MANARSPLGSAPRVPAWEAIANDGQRRLNELWREALRLIQDRGDFDAKAVQDLFDEMDLIRVQLRVAGQVLGLLSPWGQEAIPRRLAMSNTIKLANTPEPGRFDFIPHPIARRAEPGEFVTIYADASKLDKEWAKDEDEYLPSEGKGGSEVEGRREGFREFTKSGKPIQQPHAIVSSTGKISFEDGRHRTRVLIDGGAEVVPITVPKEDAEKFSRLVEASPKKIEAFMSKSLTPSAPVSVGDVQGYRFPWMDRAVEFLEAKKVIKASDFAKLSRDAKQEVFTVPGVDSKKVLKEIKQGIADSLEKGESLATYRKKIGDTLDLSKAQTETLFRTETKRSYVEGQETAVKNPVVRDEFPAVLYSATPDTRVRDEHWELDGFVCLTTDRAYAVLRRALRDYNCRCVLTLISADDVDRYGGLKTYADLPLDVVAKYG